MITEIHTTPKCTLIALVIALAVQDGTYRSNEKTGDNPSNDPR